ncbi:MAG: bifunctional adenosylcobinamide kinase/adenosylcobinamide-phosphate guanylyltransferase [Oscillospiraceae bacterium]|nr:bifunctional adenosylcobinamide kinase/adenosylcobinamide-phosphate guanylyltransferase [Oscillospiraceae bacterium]
MAKISFITGGASSGKTRWATAFFEACDNVLYMSIAGSMDKEISDRIKYNCESRGIEWDIQLAAENLTELIKYRKFSILDNLGAYVNRIVTQKCPDSDKMDETLRREIEKYAIDEITGLIEQVKEDNGNLLIISTELGFCPIPEKEEQRWFRAILGHVNQRIANISNEVYLSASGISFKIKG